MRAALSKAGLLHVVVAAGLWLMQQHAMQPPTLMQVIIPLQLTMTEEVRSSLVKENTPAKERQAITKAPRKPTISPKKHTPSAKPSAIAVAPQKKVVTHTSRMTAPASRTLKKQPMDEAGMAHTGQKKKQAASAVRVSPSFQVAYLHNPAPFYPTMAKRQGMQGRVLLRVKVSAQGKAVGVTLHRSSGYAILDNAARHAVQQWRFVPAKYGEKAVDGEVIVPVMFALH